MLNNHGHLNKKKTNRVQWVLSKMFAAIGFVTMKKKFEKERAEEISKLKADVNKDILTEARMTNLPEPIKTHLRRCGFVGKPVVKNADVYWQESYLKLKPNKDWGKLETTQFNSVNPLTRIAYMKFISMPFVGKDTYIEGHGSMKGKLFNLITIINAKGKETSQSALITAFSEFLLIPGYAMQDYVVWEYIDPKTVKATVSDHGITVSALFFFNSEGLFSRFETDDRYYTKENGSYVKTRFSANIDSYKAMSHFMIPDKVRIIWHLQEGDYEYYKGTIEKLEFNVTK